MPYIARGPIRYRKAAPKRRRTATKRRVMRKSAPKKRGFIRRYVHANTLRRPYVTGRGAYTIGKIPKYNKGDGNFRVKLNPLYEDKSKRLGKRTWDWAQIGTEFEDQHDYNRQRIHVRDWAQPGLGLGIKRRHPKSFKDDSTYKWRRWGGREEESLPFNDFTGSYKTKPFWYDKDNIGMLNRLSAAKNTDYNGWKYGNDPAMKRTSVKKLIPKFIRQQAAVLGSKKWLADQTELNPTVNNVLTTVGSNLGSIIGTGIGALAGGLGAAAGGATGSALGTRGANFAHRLFKGVTGYGDYNVSGSAGIPRFLPNKRKTTIAFREYLGDVTSAATANTFKIDTYSINPGLVATFPWMSQLANNFEEYKIRGMLFEYNTTSGDALNSVNTALGTVIMATQYNVLSPAFTTKQQMENYEFGCSGKPSQSILHAVECKPGETPASEMYIRNAATVLTGSDLRLYDHGKFSIASMGLQGTSVVIGELWVTYTVDLFKPKINPSAYESVDSFSAHYQNTLHMDGDDWVGWKTYNKISGNMNISWDTASGSFLLPAEFTGPFVVIVNLYFADPIVNITNQSSISKYTGAGGELNLLEGPTGIARGTYPNNYVDVTFWNKTDTVTPFGLNWVASNQFVDDQVADIVITSMPYLLP